MKSSSVIILAVFVFLTGGCDKSSPPGGDNQSSSKSHDSPPAAKTEAAPIVAEAFHGQVYKSLNGATVLTLVSRDECEIAENGTTLLCKYTKQDDKLRIVATALGTSQVLYFRFTDQGLDDNKGNVLLSPAKYDAALAQVKLEQQRLAEELQAQRRKEFEERRHSEVLTASEHESFVYYERFPLSSRGENMEVITGSWGVMKQSPEWLSLFNTYIQVGLVEDSRTPTYAGSLYSANASISFHRIKKICDIGEATQSDSFFIDAAQPIRSDVGKYPSHLILHFKSEADAQKVHKTLLEAYEAWKEKYPEAVWK